MTEYPKYPACKDSGVPWVGEIPADWESVKLKRVFSEKKISHDPSLPSGSISFGKVIKKSDDKIPLSTKASYQVLNRGEFLVNPLNLNYDLKSLRIGLSDLDVVVSSGYIVLKARKGNRCFLNYMLHRYDVAHMKLLGSGVRQTISFNHIADSLLPIPSPAEQTAIAAFLDDKTAKIDEAIAQKEQLIALLKERKQIIIQNAVTKGLDPKAKMKDSGIEWIGEIPEHWEIAPLKRLVRLRSGNTISSAEFTQSGYPVYGGNGFRGFADTYTNNGEFTLIGRQGALCGNVNFAEGKFFASEHAIVCYPWNKTKLVWMGEMIRCCDLNRLSQSAAQPGIAVSQVKEELVPIAPFREQVQISKCIENEIEITRVAIDQANQVIQKLREYRATLIDSAVTGKIKVPGV